MNAHILIDQVVFDADGLVAAIAQDYKTNEVLMMAYMNEATLRQTLETGLMTYWSRSRQQVWVKGETSGHTQEVKEVRLDCDGDACHEQASVAAFKFVGGVDVERLQFVGQFHRRLGRSQQKTTSTRNEQLFSRNGLIRLFHNA